MGEQKIKYIVHQRTRPAHLLAALIVGVLIGVALVSELPRGSSESTSLNGAGLLPAASIALRETKANIVAVAGEGGAGVIGTANIELQEGRGRVLVNANPFVEPDTQQSAEFAKKAAEELTGVSLENYDLIIGFDMSIDGQQTQLIGGPSAGVALAVAIAGAIEGRPVRSDVALTGTIDSDGNVGPVGGVLEKAEAAGKAGMKTFIVPPGGVNLVYYERQVTREQRGGFVIQRVRYVPKELSLDEHTEQWGMDSVEASTLAEAVRYALADQSGERLV